MLLRNLAQHRYLIIIGLCIVTLIVLVQLVLPLIVKHYANVAINSYPGLSGEIAKVKLYFIPGEYKVQQVKLRIDQDGGKEVLHFEELGARIYWKSLLQGTIEADAWLEAPELSIWATQKTAQPEKKQEQADWQDQVRSLIPFKINKFTVKNGIVHFRDTASKPPIALQVDNIAVEASNLTNRDELKDEMFANLKVRSTMFGSGNAELDMQFDPLAKQPTFKLQSAIKNLDLTKLNNLLLAYGKFDIDRGKFYLFTEIAAKNGKFVAYAKPVFSAIDVRAWESKQHHNNKLLTLWKNIVGEIVDFLKNEETDRIALKIKAQGSFENPKISIWDAIVSLLRNAFYQALIPGYDNSISWEDVPSGAPKK